MQLKKETAKNDHLNLFTRLSLRLSGSFKKKKTSNAHKDERKMHMNGFRFFYLISGERTRAGLAGKGK